MIDVQMIFILIIWEIKLGEIIEDELLNIEKYGILSNTHNKVLEEVNNDKKLAKKLI